MAGRVPLGTDRAAVAGEMETTFIENLRYTADLLSQVSGEWVLLCVCSSWDTQDGEYPTSLAWGSYAYCCRDDMMQGDITVLQEDMIGLLEPINSRITDPRYYLNTPHHGKTDTKSLLRRRRIAKV